MQLVCSCGADDIRCANSLYNDQNSFHRQPLPYFPLCFLVFPSRLPIPFFTDHSLLYRPLPSPTFPSSPSLLYRHLPALPTHPCFTGPARCFTSPLSWSTPGFTDTSCFTNPSPSVSVFFFLLYRPLSALPTSPPSLVPF